MVVILPSSGWAFFISKNEGNWL